MASKANHERTRERAAKRRVASPFACRSCPGGRGEERAWWLDLSRDFLGIQNNLKICSSACVSRPRCSANKVQPNKEQHVISLLNAFWKFSRFGNSVWDFCGVNFSSREIFGLCWKLSSATISLVSTHHFRERPEPSRSGKIEQNPDFVVRVEKSICFIFFVYK